VRIHLAASTMPTRCSQAVRHDRLPLTPAMAERIRELVPALGFRQTDMRMAPSFPFSPGESPFRVKGSICRGCVEYISDHVKGGMPAVLAVLPSDALRRCFDGSFLATAWYDAFALDALLLAASKVERQSFESFLMQAFEAQAASGQSGIYRLLLRAISTELLVKRLPTLGSKIFNFTSSTVKELAPGHWENPIAGVPVRLRTVYCESSAAFLSHALRATGARDFQHRWLEPHPAPDRHGLAICTVVRELRWRL
jgi:hypothetical protein